MPDIAVSDEAAMMEWLGNLAGDLIERLEEDKERENHLQKLKININFHSQWKWRQKTGGLSITMPFRHEEYVQNQGHLLLAEFVFAELKKLPEQLG